MEHHPKLVEFNEGGYILILPLVLRQISFLEHSLHSQGVALLGFRRKTEAPLSDSRLSLPRNW